MTPQAVFVIVWLCMMFVIMPILGEIFDDEGFFDGDGMDGIAGLIYCLALLFWPLTGAFMLGLWLKRKIRSRMD